MSDGIRSEFNTLSDGRQHQERGRVARPASRVQIEALRKMLGEPKPKVTFTPQGTITEYAHSDHDRAIAREIQVMERSLSLRRGAAQQAFNRAAHNAPQHERGVER